MLYEFLNLFYISNDSFNFVLLSFVCVCAWQVARGFWPVQPKLDVSLSIVLFK